jgi:ElaB/YqjD/DUF883 family membrane-anchored ribosome-binding protein
MSDAGSEPEEIRTEIERTREEMSETLGEIQERLRPDHLLQQAKDTVSDAATTKARQIMHSAGDTAHRMADSAQTAGRDTVGYMRSHPTQMALVAGGLTWWLLRRANRAAEDDWRSPYGRGFEGYGEGRYPSESGDYAEADYASSAQTAGGIRSTAGEYVSGVRETASEYAESARTGARRVTERVRNAASGAGSRTRHGWQRTSSSIDRWVHENPLAAGAIAVAVGAAIGMSAPRTDIEDRTLGETRDQAIETASRKAQELKQHVTQNVVQNVASAVVGGDSGTEPASNRTANE